MRLEIEDYWIEPQTSGSIDIFKLFKKLEREGWDIVSLQEQVEGIPQTNFRFSHKTYGTKDWYLSGETALQLFLQWINDFYPTPEEKWVNNIVEKLDGCVEFIDIFEVKRILMDNVRGVRLYTGRDR